MQKDMSKGSPFKLILIFIIPLLIGNVCQQLYTMVDTLIVGRFVGVDAIAALGATGAMQFLVIGFIVGLTAGFAVIISQRFGAEDLEGMKKAVAMSILLSLICAVIITALSMGTSAWVLRMMNTPENIFKDANAYVMIIYAGITATMTYNMLASLLRALGDSRSPLYFLLIASALNIILDLVFVLVLEMGCIGVGLATIISQAISAILCFVYIKRKYPQLYLSRSDWKIDGKVISRLLRIGIPSAFQFSVCAIGVMVVQVCINELGSDIVAAYTIGIRVENLISQPLATLGLAMATFAGQNLGAGRLDRIKKGALQGTLLGIGFSILGFLLVELAGKHIIGLFIDPSQVNVIESAQTYLEISSFFFIALSTIFVFRNICQGCGSGLIPLLSSLQELLFRTIVALSLGPILGYVGICLASPIAWTAAAILLIICYFIQMRGLVRRGFQRPMTEIPAAQPVLEI